MQVKEATVESKRFQKWADQNSTRVSVDKTINPLARKKLLLSDDERVWIKSEHVVSCRGERAEASPKQQQQVLV